MKQLTCAMCGGIDLIKQGDVLICQSCGVKYSLDEAKKMMIEGTVDVQGTVKVDNKALVQKYLANARRAKAKEDWDEVERYYNLVEQNDPDNIEAIFYSAYGKAMSSLSSDDIFKRQAIFKVLVNCISIIDNRYDVKKKAENKSAIISIAKDLGVMICSDFVFTRRGDGSTNKGETFTLFANLLTAFSEMIKSIQKIDDQAYLHESAILLYEIAITTDRFKNSQLRKLIAEEEVLLLKCNVRDKEKALLSKIEKDGLTSEVVLKSARGYLERNEYQDAFVYYFTYGKMNTASPVGLLGSALAQIGFGQPAKAIERIGDASQIATADFDQSEVEWLVNLKVPPQNSTLLLKAAEAVNYDAVKYLVELGSDIETKDKQGQTALWFVCSSTPSFGKADQAREIARLLLNRGATVHITNSNGVDLYNDLTDPKIREMIKATFPGIEQGNSGSGCYVATAVYGSYDCPQVWTLRRYRDYTLAETWYGRAFIRTYYTISPTLVKWFGHTDWFKKMWKGKLDRMVANLNAEGVEDTPYEDRNW